MQSLIGIGSDIGASRLPVRNKARLQRIIPHTFSDDRLARTLFVLGP